MAAAMLILLESGLFAAIFLAINVLPAYWLTRLAMLNRELPDGSVGWYPPGLLVSWLTGMAVGGLVVAYVGFSGAEGGLPGTVERFLQAGLTLMVGGSEAQIERAVGAIAPLFPSIVLVSWMVMIAVNGALAQAPSAARRLEPKTAGGATLLDDTYNMNPASARAALHALAAAALPGARRWVVFGAMRDKDVTSMLRRMAPLVDEWHFCDLDTPRAASAEALQAQWDVVQTSLPAAQRREVPVCLHQGAAEGLQAAWRMAEPSDRIVVFGSFYTVGPVLKSGLPARAAPHLG
jgi:hypothetical protein